MDTAQRTEAAATASAQQTCQPDIHTVLREMTAIVVEQRVELKYTKTQEPVRRTEAVATASTQQTCQPDIQTVLREMTAVVVEQGVELGYTKTQMEAMETRLKASESKAETLDIRLKASESLVEQLQHQSKSQTENLSLALSQVEDLTKEKENSRVSFSALLWESGSTTTGPHSVATTLVFRRIITNVGNAYSPTTGIFTAPIRGVYHFVFFAHGQGDTSSATVVALYKNEDHIATAWSHQPTYSVNPSNGASLLLEVGDVVYMKLWANARVFDNENRHTSFSGHLLFPM
ncbi:hypothetical protein ACEWY4_020980 [Coilia grayii]|uniref:C1q domain-containing protein n=1 Tax=Coilia grayii TaxID=363190 RepID=A0ABD1J7N4_9TELE